MRTLIVSLLFVAGCSSGLGPATPAGDAPVDVQVGGIQLYRSIAGERPTGSTMAGADSPYSRATERSQLLVSIMNVSERDVTIERLDISPTGGRVRVDKVNHRMNRRLDAGESLEVNVPLMISIGGGSLGDYTASARIRINVVLLSGDVWPMEFEVPVYEGR